MAAARSLAQFQKAFADEASCAAFMFNLRWSDGFVCPACGKGRFAALKSRPRLYECLDCGRQTSITAGTAAYSNASGHAFQYEVGRGFRFEAGHPCLLLQVFFDDVS